MNSCISYFPTSEINWEKIRYGKFEIKFAIITKFIDRYCDSRFEIVLKIDKGKTYKHLVSYFEQSEIEECINKNRLRKLLTRDDILRIVYYFVSHGFLAEKYYYKKRNYARETIIYFREIEV